jgi:hypothetical protein
MATATLLSTRCFRNRPSTRIEVAHQTGFPISSAEYTERPKRLQETG